MQYVNRKGDVYHLHVGKTKTGKPKFFFSCKSEGDLAGSVPDGFEVQESPETAQVTLRRIRPVRVTSFEREMVCEAVRRKAKLEYFIVDAQDDALTVYLPSTDRALSGSLAEAMGIFSPQRLQQERDLMMRESYYVKMMRFALNDENKRTFSVHRWCFRGSIDNWFFLAGPAPLSRLIDRYVEHLGQESFFELI